MDRFVVKDVLELPKLGLRALKLQHQHSGLHHVHVQRPDPNRVFSVAFSTPAPDRTGVPHILEHTTLCGSQRYPVRDPFFKMQTRSLANFMNAMTAADYTYYPFATTNQTDFANLQRVYLDSVFCPLLSRHDFSQEGWRLEPAPESKSGYEFKGVVFNEMKGNMSMPAYQFYTSWFSELYASMNYSAGDPLHIPDLRWEDLVAFHRAKYQPSNCLSFSYGNMDVKEVLEPMLEYLDNAPKATHETLSGTGPVKPVPQPLSLTEPISITRQGALDSLLPADRQHKISLTWYVGEPGDVGHSLVWRVLSLLLTDGHASPFSRALIDSGIAPEFSVNTGLDETPAKLMFTVGVQGIAEERLPEFRDAVDATLASLVESGFPRERVDAIVHQAELSDREVDAHLGMSFLSRVVSRAFTQPEHMLKVLDSEALLNEFRARLAENPQLFQHELRKMRESPSFEFILEPRDDYEANIAAAEQSVLDSKVEALDDIAKARVAQESTELAAAQALPQDIDLLPTVHASDISRDAPRYPVDVSQTSVAGVPLVERCTGTGGVSYVRVLRDLSTLPRELVPYLSFYVDALTNVGTKTHPEAAEVEDLLRLHTGGIGATPVVRPLLGDALELSYGGSALDTKLPQLYELLGEVATEPRLDNVAKLKQLVDAAAAGVTDSLSSSGHRFALGRAQAAAMPANGAVGELLGGFTYVQLLQRLSSLDESELAKELVPRLQEIHSHPWSVRAVGITRLAETQGHSEHVNQFLHKVGTVPMSTKQTPSTGQAVPKHTHVPLSFQVSHVGASVACEGVNYTHVDAAALQVLAQLITHRHMHPQIRERGGAYGGGAMFNALRGLFSFYSYRDPSPHASVAVMRDAGRWAAEQKWTPRDVEEGLVALFQGIDSPLSPRSEIGTNLSGLSDEMRQKRRQNLLAVTPQDLSIVANRYLVGPLGGACIVGPGPVAEDWTTLEL